MDPLDACVARIAGRQHGVISTRQLHEAGATPGAIAHRVRAGRLHRLHHGVYAVGHRALSAEGIWMAAALAGGEDAAVSHDSAAALHGLLPSRRGAPHIVVPGRPRPRPGLVVHGARTLGGSVTTRRGIACTTVARTLVDVGGEGNPEATRRAWGAAASRNLLRPAELERELRHGRPGAAIVRRLLVALQATVRQRTREELERRALALIASSDLPPPASNRVLHLGGETYELDLAWPACRLVVELDGWSTHGDPVSFERDRRRDVDLQLAGWRVARLTWDDVIGRPKATLRRIRALLTQPALPPARGWTGSVGERSAAA
jgi:predicted transcriptional regulator of viral defense system